MLDAGCKIIGYRGKGAGDRDKLVNSPLTKDNRILLFIY